MSEEVLTGESEGRKIIDSREFAGCEKRLGELFREFVGFWFWEGFVSEGF